MAPSSLIPFRGSKEAESVLLKGELPEQPNFINFTILPVELQLKIWELAVAAPRVVEVVGCGLNRSLAKLTKHDGKKFNQPVFPFHPLLHTCSVSREVFRSLYERRLPTNLQSFARGANWVITGDHCQDFQKITNHVARPPNPLDPLRFIRQPKVNTEDVVNYWLNFDGSKDILPPYSIFDSSDQKEWIYSCGVKYLAFDVKQFSRTFEKLRWRGSSWLIDFDVDGLKEVILVLIPDAEQHRAGKGDLELMSPECEGMTVQMQAEMKRYQEMVAKKPLVEYVGWPGYSIGFAFGRRND